MFRTLSLSILALLLASPFAMAQGNFAGDWSGALVSDMGDVEVIFHISADADGHSATLDVPQQGATGIVANRVEAEGDALTLEFSDIGTTVRGNLTSEGTIDATWSQGGQEVPLTLTSAEGGFEGEALPKDAPEEKPMPEEEAAPEDAPADEPMPEEAPEEEPVPEEAPEERAVPEEAPEEEAIPEDVPEADDALEEMPEEPEMLEEEAPESY